MDKIEKRRAFVINTAYAVVLIGLFYLAVKYALGIIWPFVVAFFLAMVLQKPVNFLAKKTFLKRGAASVAMVLFMLVIIGSLLGGVIARVVIELRDFFGFLMMKLEDAPTFANQIITWLQSALSFLPNSLENSVISAATDFLHKLLGLQADVVANAPQPSGGGIDLSVLSSPLGMVWGTAKQIPMFAVGVLVCIVSCCFMTSDYRNMRDMILRQMGENRRSAVVRAKQVIFSTLGKMGKSYSIIICVVRQVIEPKLVASQLGLPPYLMLMAMFVGTQLFGFIGLFLLPITFTLIKVLNDEGIIHFLKKEKVAEADTETVSVTESVSEEGENAE